MTPTKPGVYRWRSCKQAPWQNVEVFTATGDGGLLFATHPVLVNGCLVEEIHRVDSGPWSRGEWSLPEPPHEISVDRDPPAETIDHPQHYNSHPSGVECIAIVEHFGFNVGNAIKYLWRAGLKGGDSKRVEDLRKAAWYANREADRLEAEVARLGPLAERIVNRLEKMAEGLPAEPDPRNEEAKDAAALGLFMVWPSDRMADGVAIPRDALCLPRFMDGITGMALSPKSWGAVWDMVGRQLAEYRKAFLRALQQVGEFERANK